MSTRSILRLRVRCDPANVHNHALFVIDDEAKRDRLAKRVLALPLEGQIWDVTIKEWAPKRSLEQNARLHLIFHRVAQASGSDIESVKLGYKALFLPGKKAMFHGREVVVYPKTSKMSKQALNSFMEQCETHAISEYGIVLGENEYSYA